MPNTGANAGADNTGYTSHHHGSATWHYYCSNKHKHKHNIYRRTVDQSGTKINF